MTGINNLVKGAVGTFAKDKVSSYLSPSQMDFITFALNPQAYLLDKGVNAAANALGYGSQYRELKGGAQGESEYYKEVMRDSIGDMLPDTVGDFVRATPRISEADRAPAGTYTAFDPDTQTYIQQASSQPVVTTGTSDTFDNFVRDLNYGTQTPGTGKAVGPLPEGNPIFESNVSNLPYEIKSTPVSGAPEGFDPALLAAVIRDANTTSTGATDDVGEMTIVGQKDSGSGGNLSYTDMINIQNQALNSTPNYDVNVPATTTPSMPDYSRAYSALGGAEVVNNLRDQFLNMGMNENAIGSVFSNYYAPEMGNEGIKSILSETAYRNGGFIYRGGR